MAMSISTKARGEGEGRTSETQSNSHSCSFTSLPVIRGITGHMKGLKVNKSAVKGTVMVESRFLSF